MLIAGGSQYLLLPARAAPAYVTLGDGRRFQAAINDGLVTIMAAAKLDERYAVTDWFHKKGQLIVYVTKKVD
jgi:hypothetical protein